MTTLARFALDAYARYRHRWAPWVGRHRPSISVTLPSAGETLRAFGRTCLALTLAFVAITLLMSSSALACPYAYDYSDPTYGQWVRQLRKSNAHEHNIYYHRDPWNADNSYMIGIESDSMEQNWRVVLYDGVGCFIKELFPVTQYDWRVVWDRKDPHILYTWRASSLYRYDVTTSTATPLKSFAPLGLKPNGPSLNQAGDRILTATSDGVIRSYRLPGMQDERVFAVSAVLPEGCTTGWQAIRYIGYLNYVGVNCTYNNSSTGKLIISDDTGAILHSFPDGIGSGGHHDFSPNGKLAYIKILGSGKPIEIHMVNIDGTNDKILYSIPPTSKVHNLHLSWPDKVNNWFVASLFPSASNSPSTYAPPFDELLKVHTDGSVQLLARTGTSYGSEVSFWSQPLASPSSDGTRLYFNSTCSNDLPTLGCLDSGTIDAYILFIKSPKSSR